MSVSSEEASLIASVRSGSTEGGDGEMALPLIKITRPLESQAVKRRRKQERPHRSLKQLASVAEKILHGIIVIEPFLPWEREAGLKATPLAPSGGRTAGMRRRGGRSEGEEGEDDGGTASDEHSLGSPQHAGAPQSSLTHRPTVTRSPAPMGIPLAADTAEPGLGQRRDWYEAILSRRRTGPSRAGMPLDITAAPGSSLLDARDFEICSTLRLYPLQFFQSRDTLVRNYHTRGFYKKSAAQKMLHIDVNKTGKLYDYFVSRGWMPPSPSPADTAAVQLPPQIDWHPIEPLPEGGRAGGGGGR